MVKLTKKQQMVYDFILEFVDEHGYPPSVREISEKFGFISPSTAHFHIKSLKRLGVIDYQQHKTRAITILEDRRAYKRQVPLVGFVAAGTPILAEENIEEYVPYDVGGDPGEHFALTVRGESMLEAGILPGDLVVVRQQQEASNGDIVVALFENEATVKTFRLEDGHIWLYPENSSGLYQPIDGEGCSILGKVIAVIRRY